MWESFDYYERKLCNEISDVIKQRQHASKEQVSFTSRLYIVQSLIQV